LADGRIDIGLIVKPEIPSDIGFYSLGEIEDVFIATKSYIDNLHVREDASIFEKANIMLLDGANYSRMHVDRYFKENNIIPEHILEVSGMDMLIEFAKTGIGVGCAIKRFVQQELNDGKLVEIPLSVPINKREVGFAYMKNTKPTSAMERFKKFYETYPS
ncbi:MAG: LysR family transcriptional regulator substrate-binding protein, partial [Oscillospiraceae bacterium]|nr:LysR family transcriptional regulator substrate-binding protein [Oscillospiraceae bacterium]